jgi:hypothetical protein
VATPTLAADPRHAARRRRAPYWRSLERFPRVRQSLLAKFFDCQLSAGFELSLSIIHGPDAEGLHRSGWTSHRAGAGRIAHEVIAASLRHMLAHEAETIAPEIVMDFLDKAMRQRDRPIAETFALPPKEIVQLRKTLRKWARDNVITIDEVYGIEERLEAVVSYTVDGVTVERVLTGQLDLLLLTPDGKHATVPDWKDTWKLPPQAVEDEDEDLDDDTLSPEGYFQQRFYALLVFLFLPQVQSVTTREFYLRRSEPREATIWRHELPDLIAEFSATVERFDRSAHAAFEPAPRRRKRRKPLATVREWGEPSPGAHCSYCPKAVECPIDPDARAGGQFASPEAAERGVGELLKARAVVKQLAASVEAWTNYHGPVRVRDAKRDRVFGHIQTSRTARPTRRQVEQSLLAGRSPLDLFRTTTHTRLSDYTPERGDLAGLDDDDHVEIFARAAERARQRRERAKS